jgi:hypothetical protein
VSAEVSNAEWIASLTAEQVMTGIARAIEARDWTAMEGLLKILAVKDPEKADAVYAALLIASARHAATTAEENDQ